MEKTVQADPSPLASPDEWHDPERQEISLDQVRQALATMQGSLSEATIEERQER
jgi:hypothetical protein